MEKTFTNNDILKAIIMGRNALCKNVSLKVENIRPLVVKIEIEFGISAVDCSFILRPFPNRQ